MTVTSGWEGFRKRISWLSCPFFGPGHFCCDVSENFPDGLDVRQFLQTGDQIAGKRRFFWMRKIEIVKQEASMARSRPPFRCFLRKRFSFAEFPPPRRQSARGSNGYAAAWQGRARKPSQATDCSARSMMSVVRISYNVEQTPRIGGEVFGRCSVFRLWYSTAQETRFQTFSSSSAGALRLPAPFVRPVRGRSCSRHGRTVAAVL